MDNERACCELSDEDLRAAVKDLKTYVDVTEEDLMKIYAAAIRHARERLASRVPVRDAMTKEVITVRREADVHEAAKLLSERKISGMPVTDDRGRVVGVISEADLLFLAGVKRGHTFGDVLRHVLGEPVRKRKAGNTVGDVMSSPALTISSDADIREAARVFDQRRIKRLPVVDSEGNLVGIISRADIVRVMGRST